ncbi:MAG TPA: Gfo/Idh/MocA family oxidoreductase [Chloroflexota bacterium]|jgi:myo-inositol 2-dehydrogenase/D-chiro-inositol 1-dehydrogenase|nr:Gfo/Idh/MocA family oxidoreductase [Chloroflexota bacterium]
MTVRIGFVGAGGRTVREMLDLVQIPDAEIVALCDVDLERCAPAVQRVKDRTASGGNAAAIERAQALQPAFYPDVQRMLDGSELDAVYVSLPPFAHGAVEHAVVDAGKAIFVEKPVAITMTEAREIQAHIEERGVISCVGYQSRYSTAVQAARQRLQGVPIGLLIAIRLGGLPGTPWWRVQDRSGGMLIEQHTHGVDLMRYLAGEVESVFAYAGTRLLTEVPNLDIADVNAATIRFMSGAVGSIVNSCALQAGQGSPPNLSGAVHVVAKDMTLMVSAGALQVMRPERQREEVPGEGDANLRMNQVFVEAVKSGDGQAILSDYAEGVRTFAVTYACHLSATEGREVRLD